METSICLFLGVFVPILGEDRTVNRVGIRQLGAEIIFVHSEGEKMKLFPLSFW